MGCCMPSQACKEKWVTYCPFLKGLFESAVHLSVRLKKLNTLFRWLCVISELPSKRGNGGWDFNIMQTFLGEMHLCLFNFGSVSPANCALFLNVSLGLLFSVFRVLWILFSRSENICFRKIDLRAPRCHPHRCFLPNCFLYVIEDLYSLHIPHLLVLFGCLQLKWLFFKTMTVWAVIAARGEGCFVV